MPADFVATLRADRNGIDTAKNTKEGDNIEGLESTAAIDTLLRQGGDEVIRLDAIMQNLYARDADTLHAWLAASRVQRQPKKKKDDGGTTNPPATPTTPAKQTS